MKEKIHEGVVQYRKEDNAVLLDVRTDEEFSEGHIFRTRVRLSIR